MWFWSGVALIAAAVVLFGFSRWRSSHEMVENGLVLSGCLACLVNGIALVVVAFW